MSEAPDFERFGVSGLLSTTPRTPEGVGVATPTLKPERPRKPTTVGTEGKRSKSGGSPTVAGVFYLIERERVPGDFLSTAPSQFLIGGSIGLPRRAGHIHRRLEFEIAARGSKLTQKLTHTQNVAILVI